MLIKLLKKLYKVIGRGIPRDQLGKTLSRKVYLPGTMDILHLGHVLAIQKCTEYGDVIIGLLTDEAIENYRGQSPTIPFKERLGVLQCVVGVSEVRAQDSLSPDLTDMDYLASGDGFEPEEIEPAKKYGCGLLNIKLDGEGEKMYSSTAIKKRCQQF